MKARFAAAAIVTMWSAHVVVAQASQLRLGVTATEYFGEVYTDLPVGGGFVFFVGEPIRLTLAIGNSDRQAAHEVVTLAADPTSGFVFNLVRDGQAVDAPTSVASGGKLHGDLGVFPIGWSQRTEITPLGHVEWSAAISSRQLRPGVYVVRLSPLLSDERGQAIPVTNDFAFEVRERTPESEPEVLRRQGFRELASGELASAEGTAQRLLAMDANSSQAHILLGAIAENRQKEFSAIGDAAMARESARQAIVSYQRALTLVEGGRDALLLASNATKSNQLIEGLRRKVRQNPLEPVTKP